MASVTHSVVATGTNDGSKQVSKDAWNAGHTLDLAAITTAQGDPDKAAAMVRAVLGCRDGDGYPLNTPERTARILRARDLLRPRRRAS